MKLTIREGIDKDSKVLKHKIALEAVTLLEDKELVLDTEVYLYVMIALVDNFIEENLVEMVGQDERGFAEIVENEIEPKFNEIREKYEVDDVYEELTYMCIDYKDRVDTKGNTFMGLLDTVLNIFGDRDWSDLKYFFHDITTRTENFLAEKIEDIQPPKKEIQKASAEELKGASDKMAALIEKFQREGEDIKQSQVKQEEIKVEENHE